MSDQENGSDFLKGLTLTPGWAKAPSGEQRFDHLSDHGEGMDRDARGRGDRFHDRNDRRNPRRDDARRAGTMDPRRMPRRPIPDGTRTPGEPLPPRFSRPPQGRAGEGASPRSFNAPVGDRESGRRPFLAPPPAPVEYPVEVRFLPEPKALSVVVHKVAKNHRAFPIRDLARLFLDNPASCEVRIEPKAGLDPVTFHQCAKCGWVTLNDAELRNHAFGAHFDEVFATEEIEGEPPSGTFVCVAKCGFTGKLLAPPNHHSFNHRVQEMLRTECRNVSEEEYRGRIETVRDEAAVQQWREEARKRTVYRKKTAEGGLGDEALERQAAETLFLQEVFPTLFTAPKHVACTHAVAMGLNDRTLGPAVRDAWRRELRYPASLFFALRGAFRHKRMHVFRAGEGRGMDFVMAKAPVPLDVQHAVPALKSIFDHVTTHPGCTRSELLQALQVPAEPPHTPEQESVLQQLAWITERGHVIEYFNGVLALPEEHPVFRTVHAAHRPDQGGTPSTKAETPSGEAAPPEAADAVDADPVADVGAEDAAGTAPEV